MKKDKYPVCEFDTSRNPIIKPTDFLEKTLPSKCVITFFRKELEQFVEDEKLPVIGHLHSEVLDIPIYEYNISKAIPHKRTEKKQQQDTAYDKMGA